MFDHVWRAVAKLWIDEIDITIRRLGDMRIGRDHRFGHDGTLGVCNWQVGEVVESGSGTVMFIGAFGYVL
jgi:hypothetical protein